jgi:hypothetical protein
MTIKPSKLHLFRLRLFMLLCTLIGIESVCVLRFVPDKQKRNDTRGRTVATYEFFGDALDDLVGIHNGTTTTKEPDHGSFYLAIEIRSPSVHRLGAGRKADPNQVALPLEVPEGLPGQAPAKSRTAHPAQTAADEPCTGSDDGGAGGQAAGEEARRSQESVDQVSRKIDLSQIGVR